MISTRYAFIAYSLLDESTVLTYPIDDSIRFTFGDKQNVFNRVCSTNRRITGVGKQCEVDIVNSSKRSCDDLRPPAERGLLSKERLFGSAYES